MKLALFFTLTFPVFKTKILSGEIGVSNLEIGVSNLEIGVSNLEIGVSNLEIGGLNLEIGGLNLEIKHFLPKERDVYWKQIPPFADKSNSLKSTS